MDNQLILFDICRSIDQISNPAKTAKPNKEEEDAHSTTSYVLYPFTLQKLYDPFFSISIQHLNSADTSITLIFHDELPSILLPAVSEVPPRDGGAVAPDFPSDWKNVLKSGRRLLLKHSHEPYDISVIIINAKH